MVLLNLCMILDVFQCFFFYSLFLFPFWGLGGLSPSTRLFLWHGQQLP